MYEKVKETADYLKKKVNYRPKTAVILGSGLGDLVEFMDETIEIAYEEIPNFPVSTVVGHAGKIVFGKIKGVEVLVLKGRFHFYEGYDMKTVTYPVYVMKMFGIENIIVSNACGGINKSYEPGTLMIINDFINTFGTNPLMGPNDDRFGPRFPDMSEPYSKELISIAKSVGNNLEIKYEEGVYLGFIGPCYETAAEIRMMALMGADVVGMSTVPETIAANYLGMNVLGISCVTNMATGIQKVKHSHERVVEVAKQTGKKFCNWVIHIIEKI